LYARAGPMKGHAPVEGQRVLLWRRLDRPNETPARGGHAGRRFPEPPGLTR